MIINGFNGYIINSRSENEYAKKIREITNTDKVHTNFSRAAFNTNPRKKYKYNNFGELLNKI
jgi:hypothetical protein